MTRRSKIFPRAAARASRRFTVAGVALGMATLLACADRPTAPSTTALSPPNASTGRFEHASTPRRLVTGLHLARGSTIGPDGALYVTESAIGRISRVDVNSGVVTPFTTGLPISPSPAGGVVDVAFVGGTAYALVTLVGTNFVNGGSHTAVGVYRVDGPNSSTLIADIGAFSSANLPPPDFPFSVKTGVQFALEPFEDGFLVTDGHLNRVLRVSLDGEITQRMQFGNIVPTGLTVRGKTVYMTEAGPVPHLPANGKVVTFSATSKTATEIAHGAPLLVDVEFGRGRTLFAISQGVGSGGPPATPALANTGSLVRVNDDGTLTVFSAPLDRPTSLKFIGNTAYIVTLGGEIWTVDITSASERSGSLRITKDCSAYTGLAGSSCTITSSNVKEIEVGTKVIYASAVSGGKLDSDIILDPPGPGNNRAFGHVKLDLAAALGTVSISGGTGKFTHFQAEADVTHVSGPIWAWNGTYSFGDMEAGPLTPSASATSWGPETPHFNLEVILRGDAGAFGLVKFRQPNDAQRIVNLDVWVRDLAPNTSYQLQRATDSNVNDDCTGTNWLTLGRGATPVAIVTDDRGTARAELFRDLSAIPVGTTFDIHFRVVRAGTTAAVLNSECYQFTVDQ